ncbi:hypothetical protein LIER_26621 [Lithospermum erythrorhizon]|uniref:Uncharacterized protein n=1 Tax=Lithospermum erythrorhizon TaxID=34254 RepID=A0AAV3REV5_LITER
MCEEVEEISTAKNKHEASQGSLVPQTNQKMLHQKRWAMKKNHQPAGSTTHKMVFQKLRTNNQEKKVVFKRLGATSQAAIPKRPVISSHKRVFQKLGANKQKNEMVFKRLAATNQSVIPKRLDTSNSQ